jgi:hypothetical protein
MPSTTLQGAIWDGHPVSPGIGFELRKPKGDGLEPVREVVPDRTGVLILDGTSFSNCDSK